MKLSDILSKLIPRPFFQTKSRKTIVSGQLFKTWKKFMRQIPREFRSIMKTHQHFILIGNNKSGKSELVHSIIEQSQNVYPFEVEYTENKDLQFYLGPKHIIEELSVNLIENRTIKLRRSIIRLWKHLFVKGSPIVVISHNCWLDTSTNIREVNKFARLVGGKLSLLSELSKGPLRVRIALTHLDNVNGYLEFAHFLKQHNLSFKIPLTFNFESDILAQSLDTFREKYLSLMLTSSSAADYLKILNFFTELPKLFPVIEEFLRALTAGNNSDHVQLESLTFSSNQEPYTSFASFDWELDKTRSIFYRHPMLKHQMGAAAILLVCFGLIFNNFFKDLRQISLCREGIVSLVYSQPEVFVDELIPEIERVNSYRPQELYLPLLPRFFEKQLRETNQTLSVRIQKHILEPGLRRLMLQSASEVEIIYMLGLIHATKDNELGRKILKNLNDWAATLHLDKRLIKAYVNANQQIKNRSIEIDHLDKLIISTPLSDTKPWIAYFKRFQDILDQPIFTGHDFDELRQETSNLLLQFRTLKADSHAFNIAEILSEVPGRLLTEFEGNINTLKWLSKDKELIESFLVFVYQACPPIPDVEKLNISQFFVKLKEMADLTHGKNQTYPILVEDERFEFEAQKWVDLSVTHIIGSLIRRYIVANRDTHGDIFFNNTRDILDLEIPSPENTFPYFPEPVVIEGRYTRIAFEKNVRGTTESILKLLEEMPIIKEDRARFEKFVQDEVMSYSKEYQRNYNRLYTACDIRSTSLEDVKRILSKLLIPSSYFEYILDTIAHHTEVFSDPTTSIKTLDTINDFDFLPPLISQVKHNKSPFQQYQHIIENALAELEHNTSLSKSSSPLSPFLTPSASITLSIIKDDPSSYVNQIIETLTEIGVPSDYHSLFIAPILQVYSIGIKDLKVGIQKLWSSTIQPQITALFNKRPFNPGGSDVATFEEVQSLTCPTSEFFRIVTDIISPVSFTVNGTWTPKTSTEIQLDQEIYETFNRLARVSQNLWDIQGNPKPLHIPIQSQPFETQEKVYPAPIISFLATGGEDFHNFNQNPSWHPIKIEWWKETTSTVAIELINRNGSSFYRDKKISNTLWSFFELLLEAKNRDDAIWRWKLKDPSGESKSYIALEFQTNPWELFK